MKKYLILISLFMALSAMTAQEKYRSIFGEKETCYALLASTGVVAGTDSAFYQKDTMVNDMEYKLFYLGRRGDVANWHEKYIFRTTEDFSKVYGKRIFTNIDHNRDTTKEYLIMDFNLGIGDDFIIYYGYDFEKYSDTATVQSVYWDDAGLKHIVFDFEINNLAYKENLEFIEGIGSNSSLFYQGMYVTMSREIGLLCVHKEGKQVYQNDQVEGCSVRIVVEEIPKEFNHSCVNIYPNPAQTFFSIDFADEYMNIYQMDIFNLQGKCVKSVPVSQSKQNINTEELANGVYLVRLITNEKESFYKKLIIIK